MNPTFILSCLVFLLYLLLLPTSPEAMFTDPDTYWHIASGDLIRKLGAVPASDTWSQSAGMVRWYNMSWLWDVIMSYAYQHTGWSGVVMISSLTMAVAFALIFANCLIRSRNGIAAFLATMLVSCTVITSSIRPTQFSEIFIPITMLILQPVSQHVISPRWLLLIPVIMIPWVNIHGEFLVGFFLLGIYGLEAMANKDWKLFRVLFSTGIASLLVSLVNPYGFYVYAGVFRTMGNGAGSVISEWKSLSFSSAYAPQIFYILLFLILVVLRPLALAKSEKWIIYSWLALGLHSTRHLAIFGLVSAPALALGFGSTLLVAPSKPHTRPKWVEPLSAMASRAAANWKVSIAMAFLCLMMSGALFCPFFKHLYALDAFNPLPDLSQEVTYLEKNHPHTKFLNSYNLGGPLIFMTQGQIPVFIDGREGTAYPTRVINDYIAFHNATQGWTGIFDRYNLGGAIIPNTDNGFIDRFTGRKGWHIAFKGNTATIFLRDKP